MRSLFRLSALILFLAPLLAAQNSGDSKALSKTEKAGEKLFLQRCSLCHLGYAYRYVTYGPPLHQELIAERGEKAVQTKIMDGSVLMPAWKYSLTSTDVDNIIAYLKTVKKADIPVAAGQDVGSAYADK
jgi:mono/diheme cytochrome c family protein